MKQIPQPIFLLFFLFAQALHAQDPQFSQYFSAPLALNPASTGYYDGVHRLTTNFRNQWLGAGDPFTTASVGFDTRIAAARMNNNILGIGILLVGDRTATGAYNSNYASLSSAYHQSLDEEGFQHLTVGFQGNMGTRTLDYNRISFNNQLTSRGFDLTLPNNENFVTQKAVYYDLNVGAMYNYLKDRNRFFLGVSAYHVNQPNMSFLGNDSYQLPIRFTAHGGSSVLLNGRSEMFVSAQYVKQGNASNATLGLAYGYSVEEANDENVLYAGLFYRHKDAVYPYIGYLFNDLQLGVSYDVNVTGVQTGNRPNRSFELSVIYHFFDPNITRRVMPWH